MASSHSSRRNIRPNSTKQKKVLTQDSQDPSVDPSVDPTSVDPSVDPSVARMHTTSERSEKQQIPE
jgi:hypothetical protein